MIDVTQVLTELDGTEIKQDVRCANCIRVYQEIHKRLPESAQVELDRIGEDVLANLTDEPELLTLRLAINRALMTPFRDDDEKPEQHVTRFLLATRIHENDEVNLDSGEIEMIKKRLAKLYRSPIIVGRACLLIDPAIKK